MAVRDILLFGDETLRKPSTEVEKFDAELWELLDDMYETMCAANGVGIAAPQIGVLKRVVVIDVGDGHGRFELVNPVILSMRGKQFETEGCLSYPGKQGIVRRPARVRVRAFNRYGKTVEYKGSELLARAFCHEIDHLNGILYKDKVIEWVEEEDE